MWSVLAFGGCGDVLGDVVFDMFCIVVEKDVVGEDWMDNAEYFRWDSGGVSSKWFE